MVEAPKWRQAYQMKKVEAAQHEKEKAAEDSKTQQALRGNVDDAGGPSESGEGKALDKIHPLTDYRARQDRERGQTSVG